MSESESSKREKTVFLDLGSLIQHESRHPYLVIYDGNDRGCFHKLQKGTTTIGRTIQADFTIKDSRISNKHCIIEWLGNEITIEDTDSTNGTYVDSQKVRHGTLPPGIPIQLGQSLMKIEYKNEADIHSENKHLSTSSFDRVTGSFNLEHFIKLASMEIDYAGRNKQALGIIMMNIDNFKQVNDTFGNKLGDFVLSQIANIVEENKRSEGLFARYARDEFIYLPRGEINKDFMRINCERLRKTIENTPFNFEEVSIRITSSFGFHFKEIEGENAEEILNDLICEANQALQNAKERGKNRTESLL
jgi:two-component system cell cycle response regulator